MLTDEEGDTISFYSVTIDKTPAPNITFDSVTETFTGTPVVADVSAGVLDVDIVVKDQHYPITDTNTVVQQLYILANRAPYNVSSISTQTSNAGYAWTFAFADNLFTDDDGEDIVTYTFECNETCTWLSLDSDTRTFSGTPSINADAKNYTITLLAHDSNANSDHGKIEFSIEIVPNKIPESDQGLYVAPVNVSVYEEFSYTVPDDAFKDYEGDTISIRHELIPNNFTTTYYPGNKTVAGTQTDNTKFGSYKIRFYVEDNWNVSAYTADLDFEIYENLPPTVNTVPIDPACIIAHDSLVYDVPKSYFSDPESEGIIYTWTFSGTAAQNGWLSSSENSTHILLGGIPSNTQFGNLTATLILDDGHNGVANTTTDVTI